jgi:hypothetical protein
VKLLNKLLPAISYIAILHFVSFKLTKEKSPGLTTAEIVLTANKGNSFMCVIINVVISVRNSVIAVIFIAFK